MTRAIAKNEQIASARRLPRILAVAILLLCGLASANLPVVCDGSCAVAPPAHAAVSPVP